MQEFGDDERIGETSTTLHDAEGISHVEEHRTHDGQVEVPELVR